MSNLALRKRTRPLLALAVVVTSSAIAPTAWARGYGAISGTTWDKNFSQFQHFNAGGVANGSSSARDWLIPINLRAEGCDPPSTCTLKATFKGGTGGASCVRAYRVNELGQNLGLIPSSGEICHSSSLATKTIGTVSTPASGGTLLVVARLAGGSGAITSVQLTAPGQFGTSKSIGAIRGMAENFDLSNWGEYGLGGIRNKSTSMRGWWISVPRGEAAEHSSARVVFGGGFGGQSCVTAFSVNASGSFVGSFHVKCGTGLTDWDFGVLDTSGIHTMYVADLARASTTGATDGGFLATVRY